MPNPMNIFRTRSLLASLTLSLFAFSSCEQQKVVLAPGEDDLVILNGCVISACNYLAVVKTQHKLDANFWAKVLLVRFSNHPAGHAYCVWETEGTIYGYDRNSGGFPIPVYTRDPRAIAIVLAQELSKILQEPLAVASADFVEPTKVELYKFSDSRITNSAPPVLLGLSATNSRGLSLVP
jgi:hypothetical protein